MCVTGLCVICSRFTDGDITECYIYKSGTDSLDSIHPLRLFFFVRQLFLTFQPKEKIVSSVMSKDKSGNNLSVWPLCCFSIR